MRILYSISDRLRALATVRTVALLVAVLLVAAGFVGLRDRSETEVTGIFSSAEGLYEGDDVKVLGVAVGTVSTVKSTPQGVEVTMKVAGSQRIPSDAKAAIVSPTLVSGRYVQLSPAYTKGDAMSDGEMIPVERTAVPVSFDEVKRQLTDLSSTLAPEGEDSQPLKDTIEALDDNLRAGNADDLASAIKGLRTTTETLSDGRSDLFETVTNLNDFTRNLAVNDAAVSSFTEELSAVSDVLSRNRESLTLAMRSLSDTLDSTDGFLDENRTRIRTSAEDLNSLAKLLADRSNELAGVLQVAPTVLINLFNIIEDQAITGRASLTGLTDAAQLLCGAVLGVGGTAQQCRDALAPLIDLLKESGVVPPILGGDAESVPTDPSVAGAPGQTTDPEGGGLAKSLQGLGDLLPGLLGTSMEENK